MHSTIGTYYPSIVASTLSALAGQYGHWICQQGQIELYCCDEEFEAQQFASKRVTTGQNSPAEWRAFEFNLCLAYGEGVFKLFLQWSELRTETLVSWGFNQPLASDLVVVGG